MSMDQAEAPPTETFGEVEKRQAGVSVTDRARSAYDERQIALIRETVARNATIPELHMFLELCARYELDPFSGQVYYAKLAGADKPGSIIVGRDGFLTIANRHPDFEGFRADCVYSGDDYKKLAQPVRMGEQLTFVEHSYAVKERGELIGAYAEVYRTGRLPTYFFAYLDQYFPKSQAKLERSPWSSQRDVMMTKCALTTSLRLAFNITGLVGEEEASIQLAKVRNGEDAEPLIVWPDDPELRARLQQLFAAANALRPDSFRDAKVRMLVSGKSEEECRRVAADLEAFIRDHGGVVPEPPDVLDGDVEDVTDDGEVEDNLTDEERAEADRIAGEIFGTEGGGGGDDA